MKTTITDRHGNIEQELSYDPWGTRRNPDTWHTHNNQNLEAPMFDRGYTGHEHLYAFGLINMNGRMYDPLTSSFLSVDAYVQSPDNAQSFNRYAYCQNNPLRYVDPSGWYMQGASYGTPVTGSSWGESYSQHAYEPRELGMLQLPENKVMTWWMEGDNMLGGGGGGGSSSYGGFYDEKGRYLGSDRQNTGKVYVIRSEIKEVMDKKDEIISFFLNESSSLSWNDVYNCFVEIVPSRFMRNMMYTIVSKDDGKGGTKESNNREYGGFINEVGMVIAVDAGEPKNPNVHGDIISIDFPYGTKYATFHSHPSGTGESYFDDLGEHTPIFQQEPTKTDFSIAGNHICYVFGRRSDLVYVYNKNGIQTIIQTSCFINKFNP